MSTIGTTNVSHAAGKPQTSKTFYAAGRLWAFYFDSGNHKYRSSTDDGATWSTATTIVAGTVGYEVAVGFDGTYFHLVKGFNSDLSYMRGTPNGTTGVISFTSAVTLGLTNAWIDSLTFDGDGKVLISYTVDSQVYVGKNNNTNGTWSNVSGYPKQISSTTASDYFSQVVKFSSGWYCAFGAGGAKLRGRYWNGSTLAAAEDISSQNLVYGLRFTVTALGAVLEAAWNTDNAGLRTRRYSGSWETERTAVATFDVTSVPVIVATAAKTFCFYIHSGTLYYRTSVAGAAWSAATTLVSDSFPSPDLLAASPGAMNGRVHVETVRGTSSYSVCYDYADSEVVVAAAFTAAPTAGAIPLTVQFTDASANGPTGWDWNFGDGSSHSSARNPVHVYSALGTYSAVLWALNAAGSSSATASITATAPAAPVASFSRTPLTGSTPLLMQFTDLTLNNPTAWLWAFGDGGSSSERNPAYSYNSAGTFSAVLRASNLSGTSSATQSVIVAKGLAPLVWCSYAPLSGPAPLMVSFRDMSFYSPTAWDWDFGDGGSHSYTSQTYHLYQNPGTYSLVLTASNVNGTGSVTHSITATQAPTVSYGMPTSSPAPASAIICRMIRCHLRDTFRRPGGAWDLGSSLWENQGGIWSCSDYLRQTDIGHEGFVIARTVQPLPVRGTYEVWMRTDQAGTDNEDTPAFIFRWLDENNHALMRINKDGSVVTSQVHAGVTNSVTSSASSEDPYAWNLIRVECEKDSDAVFVNGRGRGGIYDYSIHPPGYVALHTNWCRASFRDLVVYDTSSQGLTWQPFAALSVQPSTNARRSTLPVPMAPRSVHQVGVGFDRRTVIEGVMFSSYRADLPLNSNDTTSAESFFDGALNSMYPLYITTPNYTASGRVVRYTPLASKGPKGLPRFTIDIEESNYFDAGA